MTNQVTRNINKTDLMCDRLRSKFATRGVFANAPAAPAKSSATRPAPQSKTRIFSENVMSDRRNNVPVAERGEKASRSRGKTGTDSFYKKAENKNTFAEKGKSRTNVAVAQQDNGKTKKSTALSNRPKEIIADDNMPREVVRNYPRLVNMGTYIRARVKNEERKKKEEEYALKNQSFSKKTKRIITESFSHKTDNAEKTASKHVPVSAFVLIVICALTAVLTVFSINHVAEKKHEVNKLKNEISVLNKEITIMNSKLELRDDIHEFERVAKEEYGMVGNNIGESRFIEISGGESIEITDGSSEESAGMLANILSIFSGRVNVTED